MEVSQQKNNQGFHNIPPKKSSKILVSRILSISGAVLGLIVIITIIIGGSLLSSRRWDPKWNPFRPKVERKSVN